MDSGRLLGFAFANADFLFEVGTDGTIAFAIGATRDLGLSENCVGRPAAELFEGADRARFLALLRGLGPGDRAGPLTLAVAGGAKASLSVCYLPLNKGLVSCTLASPGDRSNLGRGDTQTGLPDRNAFLAAAVAAGTNGAMSLVSVPNLPDVCASMSPDAAQNLLSHIGKNVKTLGAEAVARVSETTFGVIASDPSVARNLGSCIQTAAKEQGAPILEVEEVLLSLKSRGLTPEQTMLAVRQVIGRFVDDGDTNVPGDVTAAFDTLVQQTINRAVEFNATVADGSFKLVFEPIVDLKTGNVAHYEALSRFAEGQSPAETVRFAEELCISDTFDMAVAVKAITTLEKDTSDASVAFNISGRSIGSPNSFGMLAGLLARKREIARRLLIEITETSEIADLAAADKAIQALRQMGYRVGIDDFGAGAASLQYLHGLTVDFVKVDGALVQRMGKSPREDALLRGILSTCADLHIETIAEWIDSMDKMRRCRDAGFRLGQGRHFGGPLNELPRPVVARARRVGVQETWG